MTERTDAPSTIDECVAQLKAKVPEMEQAALESRLEGLLNDSSATPEEVIAALLQEFDPPQD